MRRLWAWVAAVAAVLAMAGVASADVAPGPRPTPNPRPIVPPDPSEPTCLESEVRQQGEECSRCQNADRGCAPRLVQAGFEVRCATGSYTILCAPRDREPAPVTDVDKDPDVAGADPAKEEAPPQPTPPAETPARATEAGGCACDATAPGNSAALALSIAALALLAATRRR